MNGNLNELVIVDYIALVVLVNRIIAGFFTPIMDAAKLDKKWLMYIAWVLAGLIIFSTDLNLFAAIIPDPMVGQILSAVAVGGGANILYDRGDNQPTNGQLNNSPVGSNPDAKDR